MSAARRRGSRDPRSSGGPPAWASFAASAGGVAFTLVLLVAGWQAGQFGLGTSRDLAVYHQAGLAFLAGDPVWVITDDHRTTFQYGPPWVLLFAILSPLSLPWLHLVSIAVGVLSLRVIGGSWIAAGILCWFPLVAFELAGGNINLVVAAGIAAAVRGDPRLATLSALAKIAPFFAIRPRDGRAAILTLSVLVVITVPWLWLWPGWLAHLLAAYGREFGPQVPIPFPVRLAVGLGLIATLRPSLVALGTVLAMPSLYWGALVLLVAPAAVWWRGRVAPASVAFAQAGTGHQATTSRRAE